MSAQGRRILPTYSVSDLVAVSLTAAVVALWSQSVAGAFSFRALAACEAVFLSFYLFGSWIAGWRTLSTGVLFDLPLRLLAGYLAVNTTLFALAWLSPLGIIANFCIVAGIAAALFVGARPMRVENREGSLGLVVLVVCVVAASLWCQDTLRPASAQGNAIVFKPWIDSFYHAVHLRIFGAGHGAATIEDFRLAGVPARLYHYASYLVPALIGRMSGLASYTTFAGVLAPVGVLFTGLAAYSLVGSLWGRWPGLAACVALLLLPDGAQQGMRNTFMSYHWLTQISPSATYGLALLAVAWLFVLRGCEQANRLQVLAGWVVGATLVLYKAHFFIAQALLLLLVPPVFFRASLGIRKRLLWAGAALSAYGVTVVGTRDVPGIPPIRFDGSSAAKVLGLVASFTQPGAVRTVIIDRLGEDSSLLSNLLVGTPFVLLASLGLMLPVLAVLAMRLRKQTTALSLLFPFILVANFLAMFLGLALDMGSSTPDELSHRPVMVVYFMVAAWLGGAGALWLLASRRLARIARPTLVGLAVVLLIVPAVFGAGVHRMWGMPRISPPLRVPAGLYQAALYMRDHGASQDLFQDSQLDRYCIVAALSERQAWVARSQTRIKHQASLVEERADAVDRLMSLRDAKAVVAMAQSLGVRWFLLEPGDNVGWPADLVDRPVFESGGFRLYRF
jgi:hypothetical protein